MSCLWIGVFNAFKMGTLPEFIYRFNGIFIRISIYLILGVKELILKFLNNRKGFDITITTESLYGPVCFSSMWNVDSQGLKLSKL